MEKPVTAREWFRQNGYDDVADLIDSIMQEWKARAHAVTGGRCLPVKRMESLR